MGFGLYSHVKEYGLSYCLDSSTCSGCVVMCNSWLELHTAGKYAHSFTSSATSSSFWPEFGSLFEGRFCLLVGCLTSQQQVSVSQGRICSDNFTCCHTEIEDADQTFYITQSQYTDTGPTSPRADPITPGAWQGSHWSANF